MAFIGTIATHLDERYRIEGRIGTGGMATVYRAWDEALNRPVAIKVLNPGLATNPSFVERFKREASAAAGLAHPNVVTVYNWGTHDGAYYIVMEYVPGSSLKEWMDGDHSVSEAEAFAIGVQIAAALTEIHAHGLIHRDIKPHNVLLTTDAHVKVTDFGIAYAAGSEHLTSTNTVMGTAQYVSPEQVLRNPVDGRTDLYSLGVVLYELLTGEPPFTGDSAVNVALQHAYDQPPALRARRPSISPQTEAIVLKALAKDPAQRFQTATEFKVAIEVAQAARTPTTTLPLPLPRATALPGTPIHEDFRLPAPIRRSFSRQVRWSLALLIVLSLVLLGGKELTRPPSRSAFTDISAASTTGTATIPPAAANPFPAIFPLQSPHAPTATPQPTAVPQPTATAAPTLPPPTTTQRVVVQATRPQDAVLGFYMFVTAHQFDRAAALWSPNLQATSPPAQAIDARYAQTARITVQHWEVTAQDGAHATVAIALSEYKQGNDTPQNFQGTWQLVLVQVGWLLDTQDMHPA